MRHQCHFSFHKRPMVGRQDLPRRILVVLVVCVAVVITSCGELAAFQSPTATAVPSPTPAPTRTPTPTAAPTSPPQPVGLLRQVRRREALRCGVNADLPGFGFYDSVRQRWTGFDVDFCRVVAAAVLGNAERVEFVPLTAEQRWDAIRSGEIDVLFRNSTWTVQRDSAEGVDFGPTTFHDGQGFMVREDADISTVADLAGQTVCVMSETTSEANLQDELPARDIAVEIQSFATVNETYNAYETGVCDAVTSDRSQLIAKRETLETPADHLVLGELISREPLGPAYVEDDSEWHDAVNWAIFATIYAEELRVSQENVATLAATSTDPRIRRLLGSEGTIGTDLGLSNDFGLTIIQQVGNYGDIYNRNLGPDTPFNLDRGPNKAWNLGQGGVLYAPPFR